MNPHNFVGTFSAKYQQKAVKSLRHVALTNRQTRNLKPTGKKQTFANGGLSLIAAGKIGKYWQYNYRFYRFGGRQKNFRLGTYPDISLQQAREKHLQARAMLTEGKDRHQATDQTRKESRRPC